MVNEKASSLWNLAPFLVKWFPGWSALPIVISVLKSKFLHYYLKLRKLFHNLAPVFKNDHRPYVHFFGSTNLYGFWKLNRKFHFKTIIDTCWIQMGMDLYNSSKRIRRLEMRSRVAFASPGVTLGNGNISVKDRTIFNVFMNIFIKSRVIL